MRYRPSWRGGAEAKTRLQGKIVYLVHNAINIIPQRGAGFFDMPIVGQELIRTSAKSRQFIRAEAHILQSFNGQRLRFRQRF